MTATDGNNWAAMFGAGSATHKGSQATQWLAALRIKSVDKKGRRVTAMASTPDLDRDGEIILPSAFKESLARFMRNPVVLTSHNHRLDDGRSPVVGNVVDAKVSGEGLLVVIEFHAETELAEEYWRLYSEKIQRALSVGFIPQESEWQQQDGERVLVHTKVELLEISCVPVGSNRQALTRAQQLRHDFVEQKKFEREALALGLDPNDSVEFCEILLGVRECPGIPDIDEVYIDELDTEYLGDDNNDKDAEVVLEAGWASLFS